MENLQKHRQSAGAILFIASTAIWWFLIIGSPHRAVICCDAVSYVRASQDGFFNVSVEGYRTYLNLFLARLTTDLGLIGGKPALVKGVGYFYSPGYAWGSISIFLAAGLCLIAAFGKKKGFWLIFFPIYLNPIIVANVPYPLQEGQFLLFALPIVLFVIFNENIFWKCCVGGFLAGAVWMIKSSYLLPSIVIIIYLIAVILKERKEYVWPVLILSVVIGFSIPVLPQSIHRYNYAGNILPYDSDVSQGYLQKQIAWSWMTWKYATSRHAGRFAGLWFPTTLSATGGEDAIRQAEAHPRFALTIAIGHMFSAFDFAPPIPYERGRPTFGISGWAFFSGFIIFMGTLDILRRWVGKSGSLNDFLLDGMAASTVVVLPVIAVEARFALVAFSILSVRAVSYVRHEPHMKALFGPLLFASLFAFCSVLLLEIARFP